jgi:hypothetical protein|tara:strand:+ start:8330 stop:9001 length:672 start_codon:yes stop_codon:yes gene_type:complete
MPVTYGIGGRMEFYFSDKIDITGIFLDLALVALTTGVTYYAFSYLPIKKRKKHLAANLRGFQRVMTKDLINPIDEMKETYWIRRESEKNDKTNEYEVVEYCEFPKFDKFIDIYKGFQTLHGNFSDIWYGPSIIALLNTIIVDDELHMSLSISLSKLERSISHFEYVNQELKANVYEVKKEIDLIPDDEEREYLTFCITALEDAYEYAKRLSTLIDQYLSKIDQ